MVEAAGAAAVVVVLLVRLAWRRIWCVRFASIPSKDKNYTHACS